MKVHLFFILLSHANMNSVFTEFLFDLKPISTMIVIENGTITLSCDITGHEEVAWYHLHFNYTLKLLISAQKTRTVKSLPVYYNQDKSRFILRPDSEINTADFTINNIRADDLGLYFCGTTAKPAQMHFYNATRLRFEGKSDETDVQDQKDKDEEITCERLLMFGGVAIAALLLLFTSLVACSIIRRTKDRYVCRSDG